MLLNTKLVTCWGGAKPSTMCTRAVLLLTTGGSPPDLYTWNTTKQRGSLGRNGVFINGKAGRRAKKSRIEGGKSAKGVVELERERSRWRREKVLMMLKIGRWALTTLSVNHCYSFLSTYLSLCPPLTELALFLSLSRSPPVSLTNFMRRYSKLPSPHHIRTVTVNKGLH